MDHVPEHLQQHPPVEQVWSLPTPEEQVWTLPTSEFCDSFTRLTADFLISSFQRKNQIDAAMIVHALINSGIFNSICQEIFSQATTAFVESTMFQFDPRDSLSNGLLHALSLLNNGQRAMATHALRSFRYTDPESDNLFEIFLAKMLYEKLNIENADWNPDLLLLSKECSYFSSKGITLALSISHEAALRYYDEELDFDDEDEELRSQRAALHLLRGDLDAAAEDIQTLLKQGDLEYFIPLQLAWKWLSQEAAVPTLY